MNDNKEKKTIIEKYWLLILVVFLLLTPILIPDLRHDLIKEHIGSYAEIEKDFLSLYITFLGIIGVIGTLIVNFKRLNKQQNQIDLQREANVDQQFALAVETLGNPSESARTGAIYTLYQIALTNNRYRQPVLDTLCAHIRFITKDSEYQDINLNEPSGEIQIIINLLFKKDGIYYNNYMELGKPNLTYSYLNGADFNSTRCYLADFTGSSLINSKFHYSELIGTDFSKCMCFNSDFSFSILFSSYFNESKCYATNFRHSVLFGAELNKTKFIDVDFSHSILVYALVFHTHFLECNFFYSYFAYGNYDEPIFRGCKSIGKIFEDKILVKRDTTIDAKIFKRSVTKDDYYDPFVGDYYQILNEKSNREYFRKNNIDIIDNINAFEDIISGETLLENKIPLIKDKVKEDELIKEINKAKKTNIWDTVLNLSKEPPT